MTFQGLNSFSRHSANIPGFTFLSEEARGVGDSHGKSFKVGEFLVGKPLRETNLGVARA